RIDQLGPFRFVVRLYGWLIFRQGELEPDVAVQMTVRYVMNDLPDRPSSIPVWRFELFCAEPLDCFAHPAWRGGDFVNQMISFCSGLRAAPAKFADWISNVHHYYSCLRGLRRRR